MKKRLNQKWNLFVVVMAIFIAMPALSEEAFESAWPEQFERTWVGPDYWANRLQDWQIANGRLECLIGAKNKPYRTVHLLTRRLSENEGSFTMSVRTGVLSDSEKLAENAAVGFLLGAGNQVDYRAAALIHHSMGPDFGLFAGVDGSGKLMLQDGNKKDAVLLHQDEGSTPLEEVILEVHGQYDSGTYHFDLTSRDPDNGELIDQVDYRFHEDLFIGSIALVSHPGDGGRFWFDDWNVAGDKIASKEDRNCGPILGTQYTLHEGIMKMTAQMMPLAEADHDQVRLKIKTNDHWDTVDTASVIAPGYTAPLRVEDWDDSQDTPYRVEYDLKQADGTNRTYTWEGVIPRDPVDQDTISVAGFTGNHNVNFGFESGWYAWNESNLWFPHNQIVDHVKKHDPEVLFFSGDQVYEGASPTHADRQNAHLDYLYKWYLFVWAFRDVTKDRPTVTIPDDHDVYHPNLWGQGGRKVPKDDHGGYVMPADWVRMVERTQTSHLPDPYDPEPIDQGIGVYYTDMTYGEIGFAIIEDRKFKSGCRGVIPDKEGRPDHITDPDFDPQRVDLPGLKLLGDRQLDFLRDWVKDWKGTQMKTCLSQTVFANVATHHGGNLEYLYGDLDSNGWPQSGRNRALRLLRKGFSLMIGGDQHLSTIVHHGVDDWNDAVWSMTVPSIANFYPRAWMPREEPRNHVEGMPDYTGEFKDGLGNYVTVWAATNPGEMGVEPKALHNKMPGYGIVHFQKDTREITIECWPRFADPEDPKAEQYLGWPKTIHQLENYDREAHAYLPTIQVEGFKDPVVKVYKESKGELVYALRIKGTNFRPKVFAEGNYTIYVGEPDEEQWKVFEEVQPIGKEEDQVMKVSF